MNQKLNITIFKKNYQFKKKNLYEFHVKYGIIKHPINPIIILIILNQTTI